MSSQVGIELSALACRIVDIGETGALHDDAEPDTRLRRFSRLPRVGSEVLTEFTSLRNRDVAVVVWGLPSDHRQAIVTRGRYARMRREAVAAARAAGVDTRSMVADITLVPSSSANKRRPVVLALAGMHSLTSVLLPLREAGLRVRSVVTPALALMSLARLRRGLAVPDMVEGYVALEETATALALVRNGALIAARELPWGYQDELGGMRSRSEIAGRLADEVSDFFGACGVGRAAVSQICICGGLPELRGMTIPLMERLDLEVEALDSLFGIDPESLGSSADEFREHAAELRLAWAVAADWQAPINLLRERQRRRTHTLLARAAVVAGVAAGLGAGWRLQSTWLETAGRAAPVLPRAVVARAPAGTAAPPVAARGAVSLRDRPVRPADRTEASVNAPNTSAARSSASPSPEPATLTRTPALRAASPTSSSGERDRPSPPPTAARVEPAGGARVPGSSPARSVPPQPQTSSPAAASPASSRSSGETPVRDAAARRQRAATTGRSVQPTGAASNARRNDGPTTQAATPLSRAGSGRTGTPPPAVARPALTVANASLAASATPGMIPPVEPKPAPRRPVTRSEVPLAFNADLGSILYASDRRLAIIDGRIVELGDDVRGAQVVDITPAAVLLRDAEGRLRRLPLGTAGR